VYFQVIINTEVRSIPVTKKGVYFAFRDQGACISLLAIRVYYITCPEVTASFAAFPATPTGRELTSIEQSNGVCVANAVEDAPPKYLCKGDGNWYLQGGGCLCKPGYEANADKQTCNGIIIIIMHFHPPLQQQQLPLFLSSSLLLLLLFIKVLFSHGLDGIFSLFFFFFSWRSDSIPSFHTVRSGRLRDEKKGGKINPKAIFSLSLSQRLSRL
jgi:hypothetical protein